MTARSHRTLLVGVASLLLMLAAASLAWASWNATGSGNAYSKADQMAAGQQPTTSVSGRNVTVNWSAPGSGPPPTGYIIKRYTTGGVLQSIGAACTGTIAATTCTEAAVPPGTWRYTVTPARANWRGAESPVSADTVVGAPTLTVSPTTITTLPSTLTGSITNFITGQTVTFKLDDPVSGTPLTGSITPTPVPNSGTASVSVTIPAGTSNGAHTVYAIGSSGDQAGAAITVNAGPNLVFKATGAAASRTSSGAMTVNYPPGTAAGDLVLLTEVNLANQNITTPPGWGPLPLADQATGTPSQMRFTVWWKVAGAESSVSLSVNTNANGASAWVTNYRKPSGTPALATGTVQQGLNIATGTLTPSPDVTTNANAATAISIVAIRAANTLSLSTPQGFTLENATTDNGRALGIADISVPTSGSAPASPTWSQNLVPAQWAWATFAFN